MNSLLKFDGPNLEELLARVQRELGPEASIIEANRTRKGGIGGFFAREWFEVIVDGRSIAEDSAADGTEDGAEHQAEGEATRTKDEVDPFLALASTIDDVHEHTGGEVSRVKDRAATAFELVLAGAQREHAVGSPVLPPSPQPALTPQPALASQPALAPQPALTLHSLTNEATKSVAAPKARRLRDLDLPALLGHLDRMVPERLLPTGVAPVIAVVGDPNQVRQVAASVAAMVGLGEADVVVASPEPKDVAPWLALGDPDAARARAGRWREADHPTVVAVELSPGADGHAWAASMLQAMEVDQVRLVAKAWQLADQLAAKAQALGGIDGLDLIEMEAAAEPELFLELDLGVLAIDGRPATSELWAALMYERRMDERHQ